MVKTNRKQLAQLLGGIAETEVDLEQLTARETAIADRIGELSAERDSTRAQIVPLYDDIEVDRIIGFALVSAVDGDIAPILLAQGQIRSST